MAIFGSLVDAFAPNGLERFGGRDVWEVFDSTLVPMFVASGDPSLKIGSVALTDAAAPVFK